MKKIKTQRIGHPDPKISLEDLGVYLKSIEKQPVAIRRSVMRSLSLIDIPRKHSGLSFDKAFGLHAELSETIAVKVFAMTVMTRIAIKEPDLKREVIIAIEEQLPYGSAAYRSRAVKMLKELKK